MGVETALAIGGGLVSVVSTVKSFSEAEKQKSLASEAATAAAKAMEEARKKLDVNVYEQIGLDNETYQQQLRSNVVAAAQLIDAGGESERGAAAVAGKVFAGLTEAQQQIGQEKRAEVQRLKEITAKEEADLLNQKAQLYVSEAKAKQLEKRDAERAAAMYEQQGWEGVTSAVGQAAQLVPLYLKNRKEIKRQKLLDEVAFNPRKDIKFDTGNDFESNPFQTY